METYETPLDPPLGIIFSDESDHHYLSESYAGSPKLLNFI